MNRVGIVHTTLTLDKRIELMNWLKKMEKQGWGDIAGLDKIAEIAKTTLQIPITKWNLRSTVIHMGMKLPIATAGVRGKTPCKGNHRIIFACECGKRYAVKIKPLAYRLKGNGEKA